MKRILPLLLTASCAAPQSQYGMEDAKIMTQDPEKLHAYFMDQIRGRDFANAHNYGLAKGARAALPYEQFYFVIQWELVQRMILGFEQHAVDVKGAAGTVTWCNPEFGLSRKYRIVGMKIGTKTFWGYDFTRDELQELKDRAFEWFGRQKSAADGRLYTYPPDWRYTPLGGACGCRR